MEGYTVLVTALLVHTLTVAATQMVPPVHAITLLFAMEIHDLHYVKPNVWLVVAPTVQAVQSLGNLKRLFDLSEFERIWT